MKAFNNINIILVEPSHPGNIGGVARAMANMNLNRLTLVNPKEFPSIHATARAAGANEVLDQAVVVPTLAQALSGCELILGTSARVRTLPIPLISPRTAAANIALEAQRAPVAMLFGRERVGLTNEELALCHQHIHIPTAADFSSLNLAAAVQVVVYECFLALTEQPETTQNAVAADLATGEAMAGFYQHLWQVLEDVEFFKNKQSRQLKLRLQHVFNRARIDKTEYTILRGIFSAVQKQTKAKQK